MKDNVLIAHAVFRADKKYLATARKMARSIAYNYYLDDQQTLRLENVIDEACSNVIDHAFADSQQGAFAVSLYTDPNDEQLIINIDDRGLPFDTEKADSGHMDGMGMTLMRAFCKKVRVLSRGRLGKRVQLEMDLPGSMSGFFSTFEGAEKKQEPPSSAFPACRVEDLPYERAEEIPRSVFCACGYDHYDDDLYDLALLRRQMQNDTRLAVVAMGRDEVAVGHASALLPEPGAAVGELQTPVVASGLFGGGLTGQLTQRLVDRCRQQGRWALTGRLSTAHPYEQVAFSNLGAVPTGLVLGAFPNERPGDDPAVRSSKRLSSLDVFLRLGPRNSAAVHAPAEHVAVLTDIYRALDIERSFASATAEESRPFPQTSELVIQRRPWGLLNATVKVYGRDLLAKLRAITSELYSRAIFSVTVDLPMTCGAVVALVPQLEKLGYSFSGVVPHALGQDSLRLQKTAVTPEPIELHVEGNLGKQILEHVLSDRARVLAGSL